MLIRGFTLIEVLVTLVILMFGLLGIAGLMAKGQKASFEAYQRQSALSIAADMVERINLNRTQAAGYAAGAATATPVGDGTKYAAMATNCGAINCNEAQLKDYDIALWDGLLQGYGERNAGGATVGGIVNARGCIDEIATTLAACPAAPAAAGNFYTRTNRVSVTWQGNDDTAAPAAGFDCGKDLYGAEARRRVVYLDTMVQMTCP